MIHHIVMIPGLNDQNPLQKKAMRMIPKLWERFGVVGHVVEPAWEEGESFGPKLKMILNKIDELVNKKYKVSVVGLSAGGSAALNAFRMRKDVLGGAINATGRLKEGENVRPSLKWAARNSPAFAESVLMFEREVEPRLSVADRKRILTLRPLWDEIVPSSTVAVCGADNRVMPVLGHMMGGVCVCLFYGGEIVKFLDRWL